MSFLIRLHSLHFFIRRIMIRFLLLISKKFPSKPVQKKLPRTYHMVVERCHPGVLQIIYLFLRIIWFMQIMHVMILWIVTWVEKIVPMAQYRLLDIIIFSLKKKKKKTLNMKFDRTNFLSLQNFWILFLKLIQPDYCLNNVISTKFLLHFHNKF